MRSSSSSPPVESGLVWYGKNGARPISLGKTLCGTFLAVAITAAVGTVGFVTYQEMQDDLLAASLTNQARMKQQYEDRIAALRTRVDIVTSRQLLDQQALEARMARLMQKQAEIGNRDERVKHVLGRSGIDPIITSRPTITQPTRPKFRSDLRLGGLVGSDTPFQDAIEGIDVSRTAIAEVEHSLAETERQQVAEVHALQVRAARKARQLAKILKRQGMEVETGTGGPLIELKGGGNFTETVSALDATLETLDHVRKVARHLPHGSPAPGRTVSSRFGTRRDPFTKRTAVHGGMDFRAPRGAKVVATASGVVTKASRNGGYGKMVEIDHGGGITTRYAHLSRINVKKGERIERGTVVGKVGSTGRSTGPHLHYEVRRGGRVMDPIHFVKLARDLGPLLR